MERGCKARMRCHMRDTRKREIELNWAVRVAKVSADEKWGKLL